MAIYVLVHTLSILLVVTLTYTGQGGAAEIKTSLSLFCVILDKLVNNVLATISADQSAQMKITTGAGRDISQLGESILSEHADTGINTPVMIDTYLQSNGGIVDVKSELFVRLYFNHIN